MNNILTYQQRLEYQPCLRSGRRKLETKLSSCTPRPPMEHPANHHTHSHSPEHVSEGDTQAMPEYQLAEMEHYNTVMKVKRSTREDAKINILILGI